MVWKGWLEMVFYKYGSHEHDFYNSGSKDESFNTKVLTFSFNIEGTAMWNSRININDKEWRGKAIGIKSLCCSNFITLVSHGCYHANLMKLLCASII